MFEKIVAIEPVGIDAERVARLKELCKEYVEYADIPQGNEEIIRRIGDADCVLVSFTSQIDGSVIEACPAIRYIGMCCSLYSEASSNVDLAYARARGIKVTGIRDYGDAGVAEYVTANLIRRLGGDDGFPPLFGEISEITGVRVGILGMGASAKAVAAGLAAFHADIRYYSRSRKPELEEEKGYRYQELPDLLRECDVICSCLSKNVVLLGEEEFQIMGPGKVLFNTALSPCFEEEAIKKWLDQENTWYFCDTLMGLGDESLLKNNHAVCLKRSSGMTCQAVERLNQKVLDNLGDYCMGQKAL